MLKPCKSTYLGGQWPSKYEVSASQSLLFRAFTMNLTIKKHSKQNRIPKHMHYNLLISQNKYLLPRLSSWIFRIAFEEPQTNYLSQSTILRRHLKKKSDGVFCIFCLFCPLPKLLKIEIGLWKWPETYEDQYLPIKLRDCVFVLAKAPKIGNSGFLYKKKHLFLFFPFVWLCVLLPSPWKRILSVPFSKADVILILYFAYVKSFIEQSWQVQFMQTSLLSYPPTRDLKVSPPVGDRGKLEQTSPKVKEEVRKKTMKKENFVPAGWGNPSVYLRISKD